MKPQEIAAVVESESRQPQWKELPDEQCGNCGSDVEVLTDAPAGSAFDGDSVRCQCGASGVVVVDEFNDEDGDVWYFWVNWQ